MQRSRPGRACPGRAMFAHQPAPPTGRATSPRSSPPWNGVWRHAPATKHRPTGTSPRGGGGRSMSVRSGSQTGQPRGRAPWWPAAREWGTAGWWPKRIFPDVGDAHFALGSHLNARDCKAVRKTVSGRMKIIYPHGQASAEELREIVELALEGRRRVKEQLKKMGSFEFYHASFSHQRNFKIGQETVTPSNGTRLANFEI